VNYFQIPTQTPVQFEITSDAPMNSFWIPQLGGQIYAMPGMSTKLNLIATSEGIYSGSSANISGMGFSGMTFKAVAVSEHNFNSWVDSVKQSSGKLDWSAYNSLAQPSQNNPNQTFSSSQYGLYDTVVVKYMIPAVTTTNTQISKGMVM